MPAQVQVQHLQGDGTVVVPLVSARFRNDDTSSLDPGAPVSLPPDVEGTASSAITAGAVAQDVTLGALTETSFQAGDFAIVEPGSTRQEVVAITAFDSSKVTAIFGFSHPAGALLQKVVAAYSKNLRISLITRPTTLLSNMKFVRNAGLPYGIYDQYRVKVAYSLGTTVPFASDGAHLYPACPLEPVLIYGGPLMDAGVIPIILEVQWLFTARQVPASMVDPKEIAKFLMLAPSNYRFTWDEA
jgi:hypothetical protein